jgi:hypothetical protein
VISSGTQTPGPRLPLALDPTLSFEGILQTLYQPPSTNIAAGPEDLIQIVNSTVARFNKQGQMTHQTILQQWFASQLGTICSSGSFQCILGDVSIRYDHLHGRFLMTLQALDTSAQTSHYLISVSNGSTYASGWKNWIINARLDGQTPTNNWLDFPQVGYDNDAVYITGNMFSFSGMTFQYAKVRILKKAELYNPVTSALTYFDIFNLKNEDNTVASTLQAPILRGRPRVQTSTGYMVNASDVAQADYLTLWRINNPVGTGPSVTRSTLKNIWKYSYPAPAPQPNVPIQLDTGPSSIAKVIQRDGLLFVARNAGYTDEPITVTYDIIDLKNDKVALQYRWANGNFFYPAFDVPASTGPGYTLPNKLIVGTTTSPSGSLTYAGLTETKAGEDFYDLASGAVARWGDYNGAGIDPVNGGMWVSGQYAKTRNGGASRYGTWNAYFPWSTSPEFDDVPPTSSTYNFVNVLRLWGLTRGCSVTPKLYCPTDPTTRNSVAVFIIRALYGEDFTYTTTPYFTDVPSTHPDFKYIQKFRDLGITKGCSTTAYCPNDFATRQQAATFIIRAKMRPLFGDDFSYLPDAFFTDVPPTDPDFRFIQKFRELGYTNGCSATQYCPRDILTREQIATFIVRAFLN